MNIVAQRALAFANFVREQNSNKNALSPHQAFIDRLEETAQEIEQLEKELAKRPILIESSPPS